MTRIQRSAAFALLLALPVEAANLCLVGMMFDPGPLPNGVLPKLLAAEWVFFHFLGFRAIDVLHRLLGTEKAGLVAAFVLAYLQTALTCFLILEVIKRIRVRNSPPSHSG